MNYFYPDIYQKSIYAVDYNKLLESGIKCLLFDLDNTCIPYTEKNPNKELKAFLDKLQDMGFKIILFSNSRKKRLEPFKKYLNIDCSFSSKKPLKKKFLKVLNMHNYSLSETAIIGDQIMTDIYGGNRVGITTILVNPISNIDMPLTKILRFFEKNKIKKMTKQGIFKIGEYYD